MRLSQAFHLSFEKLDFNAFLSYDVNISDFSKASNNFGGLEFAVNVFIGIRKKPKK